MRQSARVGGISSVWSFLWSSGSDSVLLFSRIAIKHAVTRLLAGGLLFLAVSAAHATAPIGATPGSFAVGPSGEATYSIPIAIPPGTNGMQPQLSLSYNSQGGNGLVGMGWAIGGLSVIHRCGSTIAIDGVKGGVNYNANDKFCLDGERLISIGGSEYRTQHESWQKVVAVGGTVSDPSYFTVTTKDGTVQYYGYDVDGNNSRIEAQAKSVARLWALSKIQDRNGNYLSITYQEDNANGDYRPASIAYTGNANTGTSTYNTVYFDYLSRTDIAPAYEGGSVIKTMQRLDKIRVNAGASLTRDYRLSYDYSGAVERSRLTSVQECGSDGICLPSMNLGWQNAVNTFSQPSNWLAGPPSTTQVYVADYNGDGKQDFMWWGPGENWYVALSTGTGFATPTIWLVGPPSDIQFYIGDYDGDGKQDVMWWSDGVNWRVALSTGNSFATPSVWLFGPPAGTPAYVADFNGDGRTDVMWWSEATNWRVATSNGTSFTSYSQWLTGPPSTTKFYVNDYNGDGKQDVMWWSPGEQWYVALSTSTSFATPTVWLIGPPSSTPMYVQDYNGDGKQDVMWWSPGENWYVALSNGSTFAMPYTIWLAGPPSTTPMRVADFNGDSKYDMMWWSPGENWYVALSAPPFPDLLVTIPNGFGAQTTITYKPLTDSAVYTKDNSAAYPYQDNQHAMQVVSQFTQSDGIGGDNTTTYQYSGLKTHHTGAASLGFRQIQSTDPAGLTHVTYYNQIWDGTEGTVASSATYAGSVLIKSMTNTWTPIPAGGRTIVVLANTVEQATDLNGTGFPGTTTTYSNFDGYWNPQTITVSTTDGYTKTTNNTYNNDFTNWVLGQLTFSKVTATNGQGSQYRESSFVYDPVYTWRLWKEIIEPNRSAFTLTTTYGYDSFGNRTTKTVNGADLVPQTRIAETLAYDTRGQFVSNRKNALNHIEYFENNHPTGALTKYTDVNNIATTSIYDGFGRKIQESRPGSPTTTITYEGCGVGGFTCPSDYPFAKTAVSSSATGGGVTWVYSDMFGREVGRSSQGFNGNWTYKQTQYDYLGRVTSASHPYFSGETVHYTTNEYYPDPLGRLWKTTESGPGNRTTTIAYNGLTTTVTSPPTTASPSGQVRTTVKNSQGLAATATDNAGTTTYTYGPFGNLLNVAKSYDTNAPVAMDYDIRGRKIWMKDPDMGIWTYNYSVLGELIWQKDAKLQTITMTYDELGRMKTRVLPGTDGTSTWNYDTATKGVGKIASVSSNANETYVYDSTYGYLNSVTTSISGITYTTSYTYDVANGGRLDTITYPTVNTTTFKLKQVYDLYGHLKEVRKDTATGSLYWQATAFDAHGRLTQETFGNSLISTRTYDHETGDLQFIKTGPSASPTSIQNSGFIFDALDNLTHREWLDGSAIRKEDFGYDTLNRLTSVTGTNGPVAKTYVYALNGNITSKTGVGTYNYATTCGTRPHAVCSTVLGGTTTSYVYDANGNMTTRAGKTIGYFSFNKPKTIAGASGTTTLTYDANFNRIIKAAPGGTTTYIGKLYEKFVSGSTTTQKRYIYAGNNLVGAYSTVSNGTSNTRYFHTDHLGSVEVITNETGGVVQRLSYDAWGKRRNVNGTDATSITAQTTRGFTRHEHDDEVGLVNMNAREYDPLLARFITPDTIIPGATNSQSYNRYSYTNNNPLSYTDPTGHGRLSKKIKKYGRMVVAAVAAYYTFQWSQAAFLSTAAPTTAAGANAMYAASSIGAGYTSGYAAGGIAGGQGSKLFNSSSARQGAQGGAISGGFFAGADIMSSNWNDFGQMAARSTAAGLTADVRGGSFSDAFRTSFEIESFSWAGMEMRKKAVSWVKNNPRYKDSIGSSAGLRGDGVRLAGVTPGYGGYEDGLSETLNFGGRQLRQERHIFGIPYPKGGAVDFVLEAFSGPHDFLDGPLYHRSGGFNRDLGIYTPLGLAYSAATIPVAAPFAGALMVQPIQQHLWAVDQ